MTITLADIEEAATVVHRTLPATPQYCWPQLSQHLGAETWVKHENHTPVGAFKIRGGLVYFEQLQRSGRLPAGVISATRGNHGQSIAFAAQRHGVPATIVVPHGNSREKNEAMRALGAELIEHGEDFQAAREHANTLAAKHSLHMVSSFHPLLVTGVATYALELLRAVEQVDTVYVPIGLGSGICGMLSVRDLLGLRTRVVGVVSAHAQAYARSFASGTLTEAEVSTKLADGMACRTPEPDAMDRIWQGVERIVEVTDEEVANAMRVMFECTHNVCEGAGAAALAAAIQERSHNSGRRIALVASGGNVDREVFARVLAGAHA